MEKKDTTPLWVFLAFSSIQSRKGALILIWICLLCSFLFIPFSWYPWREWIDWTWASMMFVVTIWYWLALRWCDKNAAWE